MREEINERILTVLDHGQYIMGPEVFELEEKLADYVGARHCVVCGSGTDALILSLMASGVKPGDEVITTTFTFIATGEAIAILGATPVFVDIRADTYNIDPDLFEKAITPKTKAVIPVDLYGQCADYDEINRIAKKHGITVIADGAQSFGATYKGQKACSLGDIGCASFFPAKPLGCYGDGGACFTDSDEIAENISMRRVHGQKHKYESLLPGFNFRMDTIQASILLVKLKKFPEEIKARDKIAARYDELLKGTAHTPFIAEGSTSIFAQYTIELDNRDAVQAMLKEQGIPSVVYYPVPLHKQPVFSHLNHKQEDFPVTQKATERVLSLPMSPYLTEKDQDTVVDALKNASSR